MKKKRIGILLGLAGVSLLTVGFSAWILVDLADEKTTGNIDVNVGETETHIFTFENLQLTDPKVRFDALKGDKDGLVQNNSETEYEDMTFGFSFTITNALNDSGTEYDSVFANTKLTFKLTSSSSDYISAIDKNYIVAPIDKTTGDELLFTSFTEDKAKKEENHTNASTYLKKKVTLEKNVTNPKNLDVKIEYGFAWGSLFKNENPSKTESVFDWNGSYLTALNELKKLNTSTFTVTINHVEATPAP